MGRRMGRSTDCSTERWRMCTGRGDAGLPGAPPRSPYARPPMADEPAGTVGREGHPPPPPPEPSSPKGELDVGPVKMDAVARVEREKGGGDGSSAASGPRAPGKPEAGGQIGLERGARAGLCMGLCIGLCMKVGIGLCVGRCIGSRVGGAEGVCVRTGTAYALGLSTCVSPGGSGSGSGDDDDDDRGKGGDSSSA